MIICKFFRYKIKFFKVSKVTFDSNTLFSNKILNLCLLSIEFIDILIKISGKSIEILYSN
jgi:hypothetical protein